VNAGFYEYDGMIHFRSISTSALSSDAVDAYARLFPMSLEQEPKPDEPEPKKRGDAAPQLCGQLWMIRRFTSARLFPRSAGAKQKNHSGSGHYGECRLALRHFNRNGFFCRKRQESGDKGLSRTSRNQ
jgi:hypothetical protein